MTRDRETVHYETVPHDLQLRMVMGDGLRALVRWRHSAPQTDFDKRSLQRAAQFLTGQEDVEPQARHLQPKHAADLVADTRQILKLPEQASGDNVQSLLGRAAVTLEGLNDGSSQLEAWEVDFAEDLIDGLEECAGLRNAQVADVVIRDL